MDGVLELFLKNPWATAFGAMGLLCQLAWPLFRTRRTIMAVQFGIGADYALHYALLGAWSGAAVAGLGATQSALAFFAGDRPFLARLGPAYLPIVAAVSVVTWSGLASLFAFAAITLITLSRMQRDTLRLRVLHLSAAPFGMGYDIMVGAAPALVGAVVSAAVAATMLAREMKSRRAAVAAV